jgi:serine/threonine protein kinase
MSNNHEARLAISSGIYLGQQHVLKINSSVIVGRDAEAQWCLADDPYFSRYQFRIEHTAQGCMLFDLGSRNGTFVNGAKVVAQELHDGDCITCGETNFRVHLVQRSNPVETLELTRGHAEPGSTLELPRLPAPERRATIGDYEILGELGQGMMGLVYHARHAQTQADFALKLLSQENSDDDEGRELFNREARMLSGLTHPHIVRYFAYGKHEGVPYLVMEKLPLIQFEAELARQPLPRRVRVACRVVGKLLAALQYVHERGIVHRDVKPSNILIFRSGPKIGVKLADFGLAKNYADAGQSSLSVEGQIRGTLGYIAPEQILDCRFSKPSCDLYSAGACLYYYLTGKSPHEVAGGTNQVLSSILKGRDLTQDRQLHAVDPQLVGLLQNVLQPLAQRRYKTCAEFARDLQLYTSNV